MKCKSQPLLLHAIVEPAHAVPAILCTTDPVLPGNEADDSETVNSANSHYSESFVYALEVLRRANARFPDGPIPVNPLPSNLCELPSGFRPIHPEPFTKEEKERRNAPTIFIPTSYIKHKESTHTFYGATWVIYLTDEGLRAVTTVCRGGRLLLEIDNVLGKPVTCPAYYFTRLRLLDSGMAYVEAFAYAMNDLVVPQTSRGWPPIVLCLPARHVAMAYSKDMVVWEKQHFTKKRELGGPILRFFSMLFPRKKKRQRDLVSFFSSPFYGHQTDEIYDEPLQETNCLEIYFL